MGIWPRPPKPPTPPSNVFCAAPSVTDPDGQPVVGAVVLIGGKSGRTNQDGYLYLGDVPAGVQTLRISAEGFIPYSGDYQINSWQCDMPIRLQRSAPAPVPLPSLSITGRNFVTPQGLHPYRGFTDFSLMKLLAEGHDIRPILRSRKALGANEVRVLLDLNFGPDWRYEPYPDERDQTLTLLLGICESEGMFCEPIFFGNHEHDYYGDANARRERLDRLSAVCRGKRAAVPESWNEADHGPAPASPTEQAQPAGLMISHGSCTGDVDPFAPIWTHSTFHPGRSFDWPRKMKSAMEFELRDGKPCKVNEPMGAGEINIPGRRDTNPRNFYDAAVVSVLMTQGCLFHSDAGLRSEALGPVQQQCAEAFFRGLSDVPVETRTWRYTRGGLNDCPVMHDDTQYSRLFVMYNDTDAWGIAVQAVDGWKPIPRRGTIDLRKGDIGQVFHQRF